MRSGKPEFQIKIAKERMEILIDEAAKRAASDPALAKRYIRLLKRIGMRYNVRIPPLVKNRFCKYCSSYLNIGKNSFVRVKKGVAVVTCNECKKSFIMASSVRRRKAY
ncbi:MAG: ribonuclease P [Candidatus Aenigmarchaeota archaeon]|nr:ribonuclease P [Candidatus Aenigmarchaeota archaeon]